MQLNELNQLDPEVRELLPVFLEGSRTRLESLPSLVAARSFEEIRRLGHGLKGTSAMYQLTDFIDLGVALEHAALRGDESAIDRCRQEWQQKLDLLASVLES